MQPRQSRTQPTARGSVRQSLAARSRPELLGSDPSASSASSAVDPSNSGAARILATAPSRWKTPVAKFLAHKAIAGTVIADHRPPDENEPGKEVLRWHLGPVYSCFGLIDLVFRLLGLLLWKIRFGFPAGMPSVSETQREDIGKVILYTDLMRLVFTGTSAVVRCAVNFIVLWYGFSFLRPSWRSRKMRWIIHPFRLLLVIWIMGDFFQAVIPNIPPDGALAEHVVVTPHILCHQVAMISCLLTNLILLVILSRDRDSGNVNLFTSAVIWVLTAASFTYYTINLFKFITGKSKPMGWSMVVELSFLMINLGQALPRTIVATTRKDSRWPQFVREGKVRENEDTSARTGNKPLLISGPPVPDIEPVPDIDSPVFEPRTSTLEKPRTSTLEILQRQRAELAELNRQIEGGRGLPTSQSTVAPNLPPAPGSAAPAVKEAAPAVKEAAPNLPPAPGSAAPAVKEAAPPAADSSTDDFAP